MNCSSCGTEIQPGMKFCGNCGSPLPAGCPSCGMVVPPGMKFCGNCGTPLGAPPPQTPPGQMPGQTQMAPPSTGQQTPSDQQQNFPGNANQTQNPPTQTKIYAPPQQGDAPPLGGGNTGVFPPGNTKAYTTQMLTRRDELKTVSILFADVKGFTSMSENLSPDEVKDIMDDIFGNLEKQITTYDGTVDKYIGDCVMALFGAVISHENDPERAVRAALGMQRKLKEYSKKLYKEMGFSISMRVGINTGKVLAGHIGKDFSDFTVMGDAVNLASRLEHMAPIGGIMISHNTYRHIKKHFLFKKLGAIDIRGLERKVMAYEVLGEKELAPVLYTFDVAGIQPPMIGRKKELSLLQETFSEIIENRNPKVLLVDGSHGVGKTRLMYEFAKYAEQLPDEIYYHMIRCNQAQASTYSVIAELIKELTGITQEDTFDETNEKLYSTIINLTPNKNEALEITHFLLNLLGMPPENSVILANCHGNPKLLQQLTFKSLATLLTLYAKRHPLVILIEDIQFADPGSLEAIAYLAVSMENVPAFLINTARDDQFVQKDTFCKNLPNFTAMHLVPLPKNKSNELIKEILIKVKSIPDRLKEMIIEKAEGNPYYIEEIVKDLIEREIIVIPSQPEESNASEDQTTTSGEWQINDSILDDVVVPETLEGLIQTRLDRLPDFDKALLQESSIMGRDFWQSVLFELELVQKEKNKFFNPPPLENRLVELEKKEFIYQRPISQFIDDVEYTFKHAFARDVIYNSIPGKLKKMFHKQAAKWLEEKTATTQDKYIAQIAYHMEHAGEKAKARELYLKAANFSKEAYANIEAISLYKKVLSLTNQSEELDFIKPIKENMGEIFSMIGNFDQAFKTFNEVLKLETDILKRGALYASIGKVEERRGKHDNAKEFYETALKEIETLGDTIAGITKAKIYNGLAGGKIRIGKSEEAIEFAQKSISTLTHWENKQDIKYIGFSAESMNIIGLANQQKNDLDTALKFFDKALELYEALNDSHGIGIVLNNIGIIHMNKKDLDEAKICYEKSLEMAERVGDMLQKAHSIANIALILLDQHAYDKAMHKMQEAMRLRERMGDQFGFTTSIINIAILYLKLGQHEKVFELISQVKAKGINTQQTMWQWYENLLKGGAEMSMQNFTKAAEFFAKAVNIAGEANAMPQKAISMVQLAEANLNAGQLKEAASYAQQASKLLLSLQLDYDNINAKIVIARVLLEFNKLEAVKAIIKEAEKGAKKFGDREQLFKVFFTMSKYLKKLSDLLPPEKQDFIREKSIEYCTEAIKLRETTAKAIKDQKIKNGFLNRWDLISAQDFLKELTQTPES